MQKKFAVVLLMIGGVVQYGHAAGATLPKTYIYGDSLGRESAAYMTFDASRKVVVHATIGQAPCDYLKAEIGNMGTAPSHPGWLIAIETAGNSSTKCMLEPGSTTQHIPIGSTEWEQKYESDLHSMIALAVSKNVRVLMLDPPPMDPNKPAAAIRTDVRDTVWPWLHHDVDTNFPGMVTWSDGPRQSVGGDVFTYSMLCLPDETADMGCTDGQITVRAPDGLHFCPAGLGSNRYPCKLSYDPGARRFGNAIQTAVGGAV